MTSDNRPSPPFDTAVLDIDGTLIDSMYAHVWSWREAFRVVAVDVPTWKVHRAIGMGGDRLVESVTNQAVEQAAGEEIRRVQLEVYRDLAGHLTPTRGATDLLEALKAYGLKVTLASSGARENTDRAVDLLDATASIDATISGDDAAATKPDADPVQRAVASVNGSHALIIGDSVWDMESARRAGYTPVGLLTGGVARCELLEAGAAEVYEDPATLAPELADVLRQRSLS